MKPDSPITKEQARELIKLISECRRKSEPKAKATEPGWVERFWKRLRS